jgi:predicted MFS family arabinose efflux permease
MPFRELLADPAFRTLFTAHLASNLGDWLAFLALFGRAALEWHASATRIAILGAAYIVPLAIVTPVAGVLVDRWELRRVLVGSDGLRMGLVLTMAFTSNYTGLCVLLFLHQSVGCFFNPAQSAAMPRLVPLERLVAANALTTSAAHLSKLVGPAAAGALVAAWGARSCFIADAVSFAVSAAWLWRLPRMLPIESHPASTGWRRFDAEWRQGVAFIRRTPQVRRTVLLVTWAMTALGGCLALLAVYARDRLELGSRGTGLLLSTLGAGAVCGALIVGHRRSASPHGVAIGMLCVAVALLALANARHTISGFAAAALLGAAAATMLVPAQALIQMQTPRNILGRVGAAALALIGLAQAAGMAATGPAAEHFGLRILFGASAAWLALGVLLHTLRPVH